MVSTRNHPTTFPPPSEMPSSTPSPAKASPTKRATRSTSSALSDSASETQLTKTSKAMRTPTKSSASGAWSHTPSQLTLGWLTLSLPLVVWDTIYMLGRPHTMPGGWMHEPLWKPYALYGTVDYVYGWPHFEENEGFGPAQGACNAVETLMYIWYLWIAFSKGKKEQKTGRGAPKGLSFGRRTLSGGDGALAVLVGFTAAGFTFWKTVLYWGIQYYSDWKDIGHNPMMQLIFLWIIPNGAWIVGSAYMMWIFGSEILQGLAMASKGKKTS